MAFSISSFITILLLTMMMMNSVTVSSIISSSEFDSMLDTLRVRGYNLFCNAIVTSDLQFDLQLLQDSNRNTSFTFFAPTDSSLFALDMTQTASSYTDTLRFHVIPRRLSLPQLRLLRDGYTLPTLLQDQHVSFTRRDGGVIAVGGVDVVFPGLFYGRDIAVHGLAGIISVRSNIVGEGSGSSYSSSPSPALAVPPIRSADRRNFAPRSSPQSHSPVLAPVPKSVSFNVTRRRGSTHPPAASPAPAPLAVTRKPEAPSPANSIVHAPVAAPAPVNISIIHAVPEPEPDRRVNVPADSVEAPSPTNSTVHAPNPESDRRLHIPAHSPAVSPSRFPDSTISLPPAGLKLKETLTSPKPEASDHNRKCVISEENMGNMQCYAG